MRDSSLSACTEAVAAADAGHLRLAFDYAAEAALMDLHDLEHNTRDGLHVASLAGTWIAFVMGFGGMRDQGDTLVFRPRLRRALSRLAFRSVIAAAVCTSRSRPIWRATHLIRGDGTIRITHYGEALTVGREPVAWTASMANGRAIAASSTPTLRRDHGARPIATPTGMKIGRSRRRRFRAGARTTMAATSC